MTEHPPATPVPARTVADLRERLARWRRSGATIALVPTMGALHEGHLALIREARVQAAHVAVSIFVNPKQFGPAEDYQTYPRDEAGDLAKAEAAGAELAFLPSVAEMYPEGFATTVHVAGPAVGLESDFRPGHFDGVATVVTKLLLQTLPDFALFGEKDYQQLQVVKRLVRDLDIPTRIIAVPTVREPDGLALSSRNRYLSARERQIAPLLYAVLQRVAGRLQAGRPAAAEIAAGIEELRAGGFDRVDYLALCDAESLAPLAQLDRDARLLAAAWLGRTRLIDNIPLAPIVSQRTIASP
jgi:pantoate--beta-alanine ligase